MTPQLAVEQLRQVQHVSQETREMVGAVLALLDHRERVIRLMRVYEWDRTAGILFSTSEEDAKFSAATERLVWGE